MKPLSPSDYTSEYISDRLQLLDLCVRYATGVPGEVATPLIAEPKLPDDPDFTIMSRTIPLNGQNATPDQIAGVIAMLASDDGVYINGAEIRADGGGLS